MAGVGRIRPQWKWNPAVRHRFSNQRRVTVALRTKLALNATVRSGRVADGELPVAYGEKPLESLADFAIEWGACGIGDRFHQNSIVADIYSLENTDSPDGVW